VFRLVPREKKFFDMFEAQAQNAVSASPILLEITSVKGTERIDPLWAKFINEIERQGDRLARDIIVNAQTTFITPIDREDIYELAKAIDDVVDFVEEAVKKIVEYRIVGDPKLNEFLKVVRESLKRLHEGVLCLRNITADKTNRFELLTAAMVECEHTADRLEDDIIGDSYGVNIIEVLGGSLMDSLTKSDLQRLMDFYNYKRMRREIAEILERAIDACRHVFHVLGNIKIKMA